jgi:hypothetical protein
MHVPREAQRKQTTGHCGAREHTGAQRQSCNINQKMLKILATLVHLMVEHCLFTRGDSAIPVEVRRHWCFGDVYTFVDMNLDPASALCAPSPICHLTLL